MKGADLSEFSASADGIAVIVNFFEQSVGDHVAVSSHEHEDLGEEFAVIAADAVGGQALVLSVDAGDEQAVEFILLGRGQAAEKGVRDIVVRVVRLLSVSGLLRIGLLVGRLLRLLRIGLLCGVAVA